MVRQAGRRSIAAAAVALCAAVATPAAAQTAAGTPIVNSASLVFGPPDTRTTVISNSVTLRVDAVIDVAIVAREDVRIVDATMTDIAVVFDVANTGNMRETFALTASAGAALTVAADDDGDGLYDAARDRMASVTLNPGERRTVFAILPGPVTDTTRVTTTAIATRGTGAPGTVLPGAGPDGTDAVVGATGAAATAATTLTIGTVQPTLVKSQSVRAPDGSPRATAGAIVTYQLDARFPAATPQAAIADVVPAGTSFVAASITLDGQPQTDAADGDAASFDGTTVRVTLGDIAGAATRTVRFQTRIN